MSIGIKHLKVRNTTVPVGLVVGKDKKMTHEGFIQGAGPVFEYICFNC
jgi:hypothetical protein